MSVPESSEEMSEQETPVRSRPSRRRPPGAPGSRTSDRDTGRPEQPAYPQTQLNRSAPHSRGNGRSPSLPCSCVIASSGITYFVMAQDEK